MKKLFLIFVALAFSFQTFGLCLSNCGNDSSSVTNKVLRLNNSSTAKTRGYTDDLTDRESTYTFDLSGLSWVMPDQPAADQFISTFTEYGLTYKFSDRLHIVGKWVQFDIEAHGDVSWHHDHKMIGAGMRDFFGEKKRQQWQLNLMTGLSDVSGSQGIGSVKNLDMPVFVDLKYLWTFGPNFMAGPQITFGRVPNTCTDPNGIYTQCGHGGYTNVSLTLHMGIPESWGN